MIRQKLEIRFEKTEAVRFISHHDLMRAFQRALRRARWPVRLTEGFNPRPRIVFPDALEVGIVSRDEVAEVELTQWNPINDLERRLRRELPSGLLVRSLNEIQPTRKARQSIQHQYRIHLRETGIVLSPQRLETMLRAKQLPYLRPGNPTKRGARPKELDLRPSLAGVALEDNGDLTISVKCSPSGAGKPLEYLALLTSLPKDRLKGIRLTRLRTTLKPSVNP